MKRKSRLRVAQVLGWADAHWVRTGKWPSATSGPVHEASENHWGALHSALRLGLRGLPRSGGLARFLEQHRQTRHPHHLPPLTTRNILAWADAYHRRSGTWPNALAGPIPEAPGETWNAVNLALVRGRRGLARGGSLPRLLAQHRSRPHRRARAPVTHRQILVWADQHRERTGRWPSRSAGRLLGQPTLTWRGIDSALWAGRRGLPGRETLAGLLARCRGVEWPRWLRQCQVNRRIVLRRSRSPRLTVAQILAWADAQHARTGRWPHRNSGTVLGVPSETWHRVNMALGQAGRGLRVRTTLARLLARHRGARHWTESPGLTVAQILSWADQHRRHFHEWPRSNSGPVRGRPSETWSGIDGALRAGARGLPQGHTLARLLAEHRGVRNRWSLGRLTLGQVRSWIRAHKQHTGTWPTANSGAIRAAPGENWRAINTALHHGLRGLPGGHSLARLARRSTGHRRRGAPQG